MAAWAALAFVSTDDAIRGGPWEELRPREDLPCTHSEVNILVLDAVVTGASMDKDGH